MAEILHITSGDTSGESLTKSGLPGEVFVWHDIMYDGPRCSGWPDEKTMNARADFIKQTTSGGLKKDEVLETMRNQYDKLKQSSGEKHIILWFDACLFDQSMLAHILTCLYHHGAENVDLLCIDSFPGIEPFHGLGQMTPDQLASVYDRREPVSKKQFEFAKEVDNAFATQNYELLTSLSKASSPALPFVPAAIKRWLQELPDPETGLGRLEQLALDAIKKGCDTPSKIFTSVSESDTPPQYWGDITLWAKINGLAQRTPPLIEINGPANRLPQWESDLLLKEFRIKILG